MIDPRKLERWPPGATSAVWSDKLQRWFYTKPGSDPAEEQMMYAEHPEIPYPCFREEGKRLTEALGGPEAHAALVRKLLEGGTHDTEL